MRILCIISGVYCIKHRTSMNCNMYIFSYGNLNPINFMEGIHRNIQYWVQKTILFNTQDYENYKTRLRLMAEKVLYFVSFFTLNIPGSCGNVRYPLNSNCTKSRLPVTIFSYQMAITAALCTITTWKLKWTKTITLRDLKIIIGELSHTIPRLRYIWVWVWVQFPWKFVAYICHIVIRI